MKHLSITLSLVAVLSLAFSSATAQMATEIEGGNALVQEVLNQAPLPDGTMLLNVASNGFSWTMDPEAPIGNGSITCYGSNIVSAEGEPMSGAGSCTSVDDDGDVWTIWWTGATGGEFGITSGTGKYEGATGGGTWENTVAYADAKQMNSWKGSFTMP